MQSFTDNFGDEDIDFVENFTRNELMDLLINKCDREKVDLNDCTKKHFFGSYTNSTENFKFKPRERCLIKEISELLSVPDKTHLSPSQIKQISQKWRSNSAWFFNQNYNTDICLQEEDKKNVLNVPSGSKNLMEKLMEIGETNSHRSKHGYRYGNDIKRFAVYIRTLAGPIAYNTLQANATGMLPSISATNKYIYRPDHILIEGELRSDELKVYLTDRNLPMWVSLSEDATCVENRVQYDSRTNQLIGFVLPTAKDNGMPIPFYYKAETAVQIYNYFSSGTPVSGYINTVMAQPIGKASSFCLLLFGSNNRYSAEEVSKRWTHIEKELSKIGIGVLTISSDSDPKFNCAMRHNSKLGISSNIFGDLFKCGSGDNPPFYVQDTPHIGTKLRNLLLKTKKNPKLFPFGNKYSVKMEHLEYLLNNEGKDKHLLTSTILNPADRQNYDSVLRICDRRVIELLKQKVKNSDATVLFLEMLSNCIDAFMSAELTPLKRIEKMWHALFMARIWRCYVLKNPDLTLNNNFMSANCFSCIEQNAHSLILIILYLKKHDLSTLFIPPLFNSQPCEEFYRQIRTFCPTYSMVATCSVKEAVNRVSKIHLLNEINNDTSSGFIYPKSMRSLNIIFKSSNFNLPSKNEIFQTILKSQSKAFESAVKIGLIDKKRNSDQLSFVCPILPIPLREKANFSMANQNNTLDLSRLRFLLNLCLKNYADKFKDQIVNETSSFIEIPYCKKRFVVRKTSLCWLFRTESNKLSSDRLLRVRGPVNAERKNARKKFKPLKIHSVINTLPKRKICKKHLNY